MAKLNNALRTRPRQGPGVLRTEPTASTRTFQGAPGYTRDPKSDLFLLATTNFVGEDTFYEDAAGRDTRYRDLVRGNAILDPHWTGGLLRWLRLGANMRSASILGGVEAGHALHMMLTTGAGKYPAEGPTPRSILDSVLQRADEPGEAVAYWLTTYPGEDIPKWMRRALGDAARRLYTPYTAAKWDSDRDAVRFADVIELSQLKHAQGDESGLWRYLLDTRPGRRRAPRSGDVSTVPQLAARAQLMATPVAQRRALLTQPDFADRMHSCALSWEAISGWLQGPMDAAAWEACIPLMGYGALLKNLGNFERAGLSKPAIQQVRDRLTDPAQVAKSRLLPLAFLTAYYNVPGDTFKAALDEAATFSLNNVPVFAGNTLILIDTSGSMHAPFVAQHGPRKPGSVPSTPVMRWDAAALFGIALARSCDHADVISFSDRTIPFAIKAGENLLSAVRRFRRDCFIDSGTYTQAAVTRHYARHDRVVCLTDEQAASGLFLRWPGTSYEDPAEVYRAVPARIPVHTFNLAGYATSHAPTGPNRYLVGGLSDAAFVMMQALETHARDGWPWQQQTPSH